MRADATQPGLSRLQLMLQSAVQAANWTYCVFWQLCPQQGILVWGDGYYNGAIKTRKTVQPMEVSSEEASLQRSQQLRDLFDSLGAEVDTNQPARRPCAALSPEDLTESEWFYLMSISYKFPPGEGLPGKSFARQQHIWLTNANEVDCKIFSRAILAKSAGVHTVLCIPLADGVVELGTTERVKEDLSLIQLVKSFFVEHHQLHGPNPAQSENSTSNPTNSSRLNYHSSPLLSNYSAIHPPINVNQEDEDMEEEEDDEEEGDDEEEDDSESEAETGLNRHLSTNDQDPLHLINPITNNVSIGHCTAEPSELMQLEMPEDIRLGSPEDGSNIVGDIPILEIRQCGFGAATILHDQDASTRPWSHLPDQFNNNIPFSASVPPRMDELLANEDTHYSETVSTIVSHNPSRWTEPSTLNSYNQQSAFTNWSSQDNHLFPYSVDGTSQWLLKEILFRVPFLHKQYQASTSNFQENNDVVLPRLRKCASQDELSANHVLAERRRREKLNERFIILRSLVPFVTKMDKASILGDTIEYVKQLRKRIQDLETPNRPDSSDQQARTVDMSKSTSTTDITTKDQRIVLDRDRRKVRVAEGKTKALEVVSPQEYVGSVVIQVSIIESDALLELKCLYKEGLLLEIMKTLRDLRMEITAIQSSSTKGSLTAELRAKVKEDGNGKKVKIVEVKRAIHLVISQY